MYSVIKGLTNGLTWRNGREKSGEDSNPMIRLGTGESHVITSADGPGAEGRGFTLVCNLSVLPE